MKPWMKPSFDRYDDSDDDSSSESDSDFKYPKLLVDGDGRKRFILNLKEERQFLSRMNDIAVDSVPIKPAVHTKQIDRSSDTTTSATPLDILCTKSKKVDVERVILKPIAKKKGRTHGLAPFLMTIPLSGQAYVKGDCTKKKVPVVESNLEIYTRIQKGKTRRQDRDNKRYVKSLKKTGRVGTLAPYMFDT